MTKFFSTLTRTIPQLRNTLNHVVIAPGVLCTRAVFSDLTAKLELYNIQVTYADTAGSNIKDIASNNINSKTFPPKYWLLGFSLGGTLTIEMARQLMLSDPNRLQGLIGISTPTCAVSLIEKRRKQLIIKTVKDFTPNQFENYISGDFFANQTFHPLTDDQKLLLFKMAKEIGRDKFIDQLHATLSREAARPILEELQKRIPVELIWGMNDTVIVKPERGKEDIAGKHTWVPSSGHLVFFEQLDLVCNRIVSIVHSQNIAPAPDTQQLKI